MKLTPQEYDAMIQKTVPPTQSGRTIPAAFLVGGLICVLGQGLTDLYLLFLRRITVFATNLGLQPGRFWYGADRR